jgi:hypothetical protein
MSNVPEDPHCLSITAAVTEQTETGTRLKQRTIFEQYFDDSAELKLFQQNEFLEMVANIGLTMAKYGDAKETRKGRKPQ